MIRYFFPTSVANHNPVTLTRDANILCRSESVWEQYKKNRWRPLPIGMSDALEEGYAEYVQKKGVSKEKILDKEVITSAVFHIMFNNTLEMQIAKLSDTYIV